MKKGSRLRVFFYVMLRHVMVGEGLAPPERVAKKTPVIRSRALSFQLILNQRGTSGVRVLSEPLLAVDTHLA